MVGAAAPAAGSLIEGWHVAAAMAEAECASATPRSGSFERKRLARILGWDTARAARLLGVHRSTVYRRIERFGIDWPAG
jgi:transcriptional regulator of acetoin/glycerol metabolism